MNVPPIDPASVDAVREALAAYLAARDDTRTAQIIEPPAPLGSGFDSFIYTFRLAGVTDAQWSVPLVLRLQGKPEQALKVRREADVQDFIAKSGYPVPALLVAEGAANPFGLPFQIMEFVSGGTLLSRITANPLRAAGLLARAGTLHADLHRLSVTGWPLDHGADPMVLRQIAAIRERITRERLTGFDDGLAWLERNAPAVLPETAVITHQDFHPLNIVVTGGGGLSVIDWAGAELGDRQSDVARTLTLFSFAYIVASSSVERIILKAARGFLRSRYLRGYEQAFPLDPRRLAYFEALQSFSFLVQIREILAAPAEFAAPSDAARRFQDRLPALAAGFDEYVRRRMADAERTLSLPLS